MEDKGGYLATLENIRGLGSPQLGRDGIQNVALGPIVALVLNPAIGTLRMPPTPTFVHAF